VIFEPELVVRQSTQAPPVDPVVLPPGLRQATPVALSEP